jgi:hypothetical protein
MHNISKVLKSNIELKDLKLEKSDNSIFRLDKELLELMESIWTEREREAKENNEKLWDGDIYTLEAVSSLEDNNILKISTIKYSDVVTFVKGLEKNIVNSISPRYICTGVLVQTSDNYFVFGSKRGKEEGALVGGFTDIDDLVINVSEDFKRNMLKELKEELDISEQDLTVIKFIGILETEKGSVNIFFMIKTSLSKEEVEKRYDKIVDKEFQSLIFIHEKDIKEYLDSKIDANKVISHLIVTNI